MIDQLQIIRDIHDALMHLYDLPYLMGHRLVQAVIAPGYGESKGRVLRRLLLDAIQEMKPPAESPHDTVAASRYEFLHLRYIQGKPIEEMARQLGLSERQLYRRQRDALDAMAMILERHLQLDRLEANDTVSRGGAPAIHASDASMLDADVDRIGMVHPSHPVNLLEVLEGIEGMVTPLCQSAGCHIDVRSVRALVPVRVDRVALRQAFVALLTFAIQVAPATTISLEVSTFDDEAVISVSIPSNSGEDATVANDSNLAVCRRLIELQGGRVGLERDSLLEIVITLPSLRRRTVLVVDDNADSLHLFTRYLEARGYHVLTAGSGEQALQVAQRERPDAIVLDVMLPSSDGYEVLQALASDDALGRIPVVVCTVLRQRELALALGATEFLAKPVTQGELLDALDRCWARLAAEQRR